MHRDVAFGAILVMTALRVFIPDVRLAGRWCAAWFVQAGLARLRQRALRDGTVSSRSDGGGR